jgi:phosphopantothenate---cysteine ligase (ATP)
MSTVSTSQPPTSFVNQLDAAESKDLSTLLHSFVVEHAAHQRPVVLISSGGTAADLEVRCVRSLENFSTGLRGAIAVEEFLKRGYAVIHLQRQGSASPFARVLTSLIGTHQANHALDVESLTRLFVTGDLDDVEDEALLQSVLHQHDPFMTEPRDDTEWNMANGKQSNTYSNADVRLRRSLLHSEKLRTALRELTAIKKQNVLCTVHFRTVEDYLAKLELCCRSLVDSHAMALLVLAAAVSDYYIPLDQRSEEKIQSGTDPLTLNLLPVPKMLGRVRNEWAPSAMLVSFKLETDMTILKEKATRAIEKYSCHLVVGNILETRYDKVWVLEPDVLDSTKSNSAQDLSWNEISRPRGTDPDILESSLVDHLTRLHFEFISANFNADGAGFAAAKKARQELIDNRRALQRQIVWKQIQQVAVQVAATAAAFWLSQKISSVLQSRSRINTHH